MECHHRRPQFALWIVCFIGLWCLGCGAPPTETPEAEASNLATSEPEQKAGRPISETPDEEPDVGAESDESEGLADSDRALLPGEDGYVEPPRLPPPVGATAMPAPDRVWIDAKKKVVIVDGYVSLQEGMLEMFACPVGTKEHESVVAVYSSAQVVHAALLAVGAEVGTPVQFTPEFQPPTGTEISIEVRWQDEAKQWQSAKAQEWVTDIKTEQPMAHPWVFAGSGFYEDEETGEKYYMAESGDFICVSNFSTAALDIPVESSQVNEGLMFEANAEKVPPLGTPVRLVLMPQLLGEE